MRFSINSRVLEHLGKDLITSDEIAVTELIKNAYDAGANKVKMHLVENIHEYRLDNLITPVLDEVLAIVRGMSLKDSRVLILEDNGDGMTLEELEKGFFTIGTDIKKKQKNTVTDKERLPLGEKGIGRLAAQRLSKILVLETTSNESRETSVVIINWDAILNETSKLDQIDMDYIIFPKIGEKYTRFWFIELNFQFESIINDTRSLQLSLFEEEDGIKEKLTVRDELLSSLSFLMSPFDDIKEDFQIEIFLNQNKVNTDFKNEAINVSESIHTFYLNIVNGEPLLELSMSLTPWYIERIHQRLVEKDLFDDWRKSPVEYERLLKKYEEKYNKSLTSTLNKDDIFKEFNNNYEHSLKDIMPLEGKVYSFKRDPQLSAMAIRSAKETKKLTRDFNIKNIRSFLDSYNGIKLYRGKFRIAKLGDKDTDWLHLQQARTKGQQFFRFELGNVIGYVKISDPFQSYIKETSSRLELTDNVHSNSLLSFLVNIFNEKFYSFSKSAYYITREILNDEGMIPVRSLQKLKNSVDELDEKINLSKEQLSRFDNLLSNAKRVISGEFDHEQKIQEAENFIHSFSNTSVTLKATIENTLTQLKESKDLVKQVEHEKKLIALESYNNYKLMANGLVTEVLTHELHSILINIKKSKNVEEHFKVIEDYLLDMTQYLLVKNHLNPIKEQSRFFRQRIKELSHFYAFMEKTFLYNGTIDDFVEEDLLQFFKDLEERLDNSLTSSNISMLYEDIDMKWFVPRGVLVHIFYNLIDNSIYWIKERRFKQKLDKSFYRVEPDFIKIEKKADDIIYYSDSGTGIMARMENTLFQPLESGKNKDGRGMGLYIVRQLLRSFGGDIELLQNRNSAGNRYIFAIYLNTDEKRDGDGEQ